MEKKFSARAFALVKAAHERVEIDPWPRGKISFFLSEENFFVLKLVTAAQPSD